MADDVYKPKKPGEGNGKNANTENSQAESNMHQSSSLTPQEGSDPMANINKVQEALRAETGGEKNDPPPFQGNPDSPFAVSGNVPPQFQQAMNQRPSNQSD